MVRSLFQTNIVAFIGKQKYEFFQNVPTQKKDSGILNLFNMENNSMISKLKFKQKIRNFQITLKHIFISFKDKIAIFELFTFFNKDFIPTYYNTEGIFAVNIDIPEHIILAYPDEEKGCVRIKNYQSSKSILIKVDESEICCLSMNQKGTILSAATFNGSYIKLYSTLNGQCMQILKRGVVGANLNYMSIDRHSLLIAAASDRGTLHIWSISENELFKKNLTTHSDSIEKIIIDPISNEIYIETPKNIFSFLNKISFGKFAKGEKSFAKMHLNESNFICSFIHNTNQILVITDTGDVYIGIIDLVSGGEIKLKEKKSLFP